MTRSRLVIAVLVLCAVGLGGAVSATHLFTLTKQCFDVTAPGEDAYFVAPGAWPGAAAVLTRINPSSGGQEVCIVSPFQHFEPNPAPVPIPAPAPAPAPPLPSPSVCATPDPFVSLGGGQCVNGGWVPR